MIKPEIKKVELSGGFEGIIYRDDLSQDLLIKLGVTLSIGETNDNFTLEIIGSFESEVETDYLDVWAGDISVISPINGESIIIDDIVDLDYCSEYIRENHGMAICQDWIEGRVDYYYEMGREEGW